MLGTLIIHIYKETWITDCRSNILTNLNLFESLGILVSIATMPEIGISWLFILDFLQQKKRENNLGMPQVLQT